jgi:hypothetical protein
VTDDALIAEPVEGWRAWRLALDRRGASLVPIGRGRPWPKLEAAAAECWRRRHHHAPETTCSCGLYAASDAELLRGARSPGVVGRIALWGRVVQHSLGWRGEFAYPQRLTLVCHACLFQRGPTGPDPDSVAAYRDGHLVALCEQHLRITHACDRDRFDVLPADEILAVLLDGYAVDRLAL